MATFLSLLYLLKFSLIFHMQQSAFHLFFLLKLWSVNLNGYLLLLLSSVQFTCSVVSNSLQPHGVQHARPPCPSPTPGVHSNSCPLSWWCHPTISSSVVPFASCLQSFPASGSFPVSQEIYLNPLLPSSALDTVNNIPTSWFWPLKG